MDRQRGCTFQKVVVICVAVTVCLVVYTSYMYGDQSSYSRAYLSRTETQNTSKASTSQPAKVSEDRNLTLPRKKPSIQTKHEPYFAASPEETSSSEPFRSPFIKEKNEATLEYTGKHQGHSPDTNMNSKTKTFAVAMNCPDAQPGCFSDVKISVTNCPYSNCRQIKDFESADVVVFFIWRMIREELVPKFQRPSHQLWVMWTQEAAARQQNTANLDFPSLKGQFNWTMTYRLDSDIVNLYGRLERQISPHNNYRKIVQGKRFLAAWFVSHCHVPSRREKYVTRMQEVLDVHIFGDCGTYNCSSGGNKRLSDTSVCFPMLSKSYFFYLAFENSLCKDYVTEKFFKIFQGVDVIPVVRGGADYKRYFPPNSFIDASDFKSPVELAKFLLHLSKDRDRYLTMLIEKSRYRYVPPRNIFCDLCEKMVTDNNKKWYPDLRTWFVQDQCHEPAYLVK